MEIFSSLCVVCILCGKIVSSLIEATGVSLFLILALIRVDPSASVVLLPRFDCIHLAFQWHRHSQSDATGRIQSGGALRFPPQSMGPTLRALQGFRPALMAAPFDIIDAKVMRHRSPDSLSLR
jgi:hypothetical protein